LNEDKPALRIVSMKVEPSLRDALDETLEFIW
jgi:hypothetical protein